MKKGMVAKVSYFIVSMIMIGAAYFYTDDLMVWVFGMLTDAMNVQLQQFISNSRVYLQLHSI